jgi:hypothetical protein
MGRYAHDEQVTHGISNSIVGQLSYKQEIAPIEHAGGCTASRQRCVVITLFIVKSCVSKQSLFEALPNFHCINRLDSMHLITIKATVAE